MGNGGNKAMDPKDLAVRFVVGGGAVVLCYVVGKLSPWKAFGGMFAAFPAVMAAAVAMAGARGGQSLAADTALGAVSGMLAGTVCVGACLLSLRTTGSWRFSLAIGMVVWFASAAMLSRYLTPFIAARWSNRKPVPDAGKAEK